MKGSDPERRTDRDLRLVADRGDNEALLALLRSGSSHGGAILYDRFGGDVSRMIWRLLGADRDHDDLVQEVFIKALLAARHIREAAALRSWMMTLAVNVVRNELRRRQVRRWFGARPNEPLAELSDSDDHEGREAVRRLYAVLDEMRSNERIAFTLRYVHDQPLDEVAQGCGCSLATIKRRLQRAERRFLQLAGGDPVLSERLRRGGRWSA